jgi:hypothetical protein
MSALGQKRTSTVSVQQLIAALRCNTEVGALMRKPIEIERAWEQHEPRRAVVASETVRALRAFKPSIAPTADKIAALLKDNNRLHRLVTSSVRRRGVARQRLIQSISRELPDAQVRIAQKEILEITWLKPSTHTLADPQGGEAQDCILVCFLLAWPEERSISLWSQWSVEIPDHAAARFIQRAGAGGLRNALFEAGLGFMRADASVITRHGGRGTTIYLPAGRGAFVCKVIVGKSAASGRKYVFARAGTWLSRDMLGADQVLLPAATDPNQTVAIVLWRCRDISWVATPFGAQPSPWQGLRTDKAPTLPGNPPLAKAVSGPTKNAGAR